MSSAEFRRRGSALLRPVLAFLLLALPAAADPLALDLPLTDTPGDPLQGRAIVADRTRGLCLLCHSGPFPEVRFQGDLAPSLAGAGTRLTPGELRLRLVDSRRVNGQTIMPPYFSLEALTSVGANWRGKTLLDAQEIEDVVAFLVTLREP